VRRKNNRRTIGYLGNLVNKNSALLSQRAHHIFVVNNFVANIDRGTELFDRTFNDIDRTINTGTKTAWLSQQCFNFHL